MRRLNFRDDRGSLVTTLVFITVGFMLTALMTTWMVTRISIDHAVAEDAQVRSAIDSYSQTILENVNAYGPDSIVQCASSSTAPTCSKSFADLQARVTVTKWAAPDPDDGSIDATLTGYSTGIGSVPVTAHLKLSLSGVGTFLGLDPATGRPLWTTSDGVTDATAVWDITPVAG